MGIKGLWGYFDKCSPVSFKNVTGADLREIVVDGYSLMYHLHEDHNLPVRFGGQYPQMKWGFDEFFGILKKNGINVLVVFDGVDYNEEKQDTHDHRRRQTIDAVLSVLQGKYREPGRSVIPLLATEVFFSVLRSREIEFVVVDGDADRKIAQIANFKQCPVLGSDSDYYIYQLNQGYIPLERFEWRSGVVSGQLYQYQEFLRSAFLESPDLLLGIPLLLGNDFYTAVVKRSLPAVFGGAKKNVRVEDVVNYLAVFSTLGECIVDLEEKLSSRDSSGIESMKKGLELLKEVYDATPMFESDPVHELELSADMPRKDGQRVPNVLVTLFRRGFVGIPVMEALCKHTVDLQVCMEDLNQPPCQDAGEHVRKTVYALLYYHVEEATVSELIRCSPNYRDFRHHPLIIRPKEIVPQPPQTCRSYTEICDLPIELRRTILVNCLGVSEVKVEQISKLPEAYHLLALVTLFWSSSCNPSKLHVESLLKCFLLTQNGKTSEVVARSDKRFRKPLNINPQAAHVFARWQVIFKDTSSLNRVLSEPYSPVDISQHYDGILLYMIMYFSNDHKFAQACRFDNRLYEDLRRCVDCQKEVKSNSDNRSQGKIPAKEGLTKKHKPMKSTLNPDIGVSNRFALLGLSDDDDKSSSSDESV